MNALFARLVVLVSGAAILVVETLSTRLVAPYVGLTLESTTAVIGVALAGIAAGASLGGRWADVLPPRRVAAGALAVGGLGVLVVRPLIRLLGPALGPGPFAAVLLVAVSTLVSVTALAMVTPAVTRARLSTLDGSGAVVGQLSAAGTLGSLAGVFLTGFLLVSLLPVTAILLVTALVCLLAAVLTATVRTRAAVTGIAVAAVAAGTALVAVPGRCDVDTVYYCARIETDADDPDTRVLVLDDLRHSAVDLADPARLQLAYTQRFADAIDVAFEPGRPLVTAHIGGGGFTMPRWLAATRPGSTSTVLEVDGGVVELARRELGADAIPGTEVRIGDARSLLAEIPPASVDVVVGDAFGARSLPWHLATTEFTAEVDRVLRNGGVYVLNVIDRHPSRLLAAELATVATRFPHVVLMVPADQLGAGGGGNAVVVGSDHALDIDDLAARAAVRGEPGSVLGAERTRELIGDAAVITDDWAPVDQLIG